MLNKNDRWSALSMLERADLMNMYITNGISDLKEMKRHYNSFGDGGNTDSPVNGGEIEASIITPRQSRINKRRMRKELFTKIKSTLESDGDIIQLYNELPEDQRKRVLESIMKFSSAADPKIVKDWFIEEAKKHPLKAIKALNYVITGEGQPVLFEPNRKYAYNGLFGGDYYFDKQPPIDNGIIDAMLYNREINSNIGVQANKQDYGPEVDYINRVYPDKNIQYIETKPGIDLNQEGIQPTIYYGAEGSFRTSLPNRVINNAGIIIQEGVRNDSTFVRGLDVYDFKPDEYMTKWVSDPSMFHVIKQIDEDTNPVAIKTPWVYKDDINDIISSRTGLNGFEFNTIDNNKSVYKTQKSLGGKLNSFSGEENHPIEVQQGLQNGTIKAIKKDDGTYAYIRQEKPIEDLTQSIAEWTAAGDLMDASIAIDAVRKGDLKQAALLAGLAIVPNALENTVKLGRRVITHNLHPDKLNAILKGKWDKKMANPSMAIRNIEDITTQEYGPITFLGKPELLDNSFIFRGDGETSMVGALGLNDVPDVEEVSKIMREYDDKQHSFKYNEPLTKEEVISNVDLTPSWMGYMEAKRSVPTSPKDFERAFIFTGDYKYDPQIQETLELFRNEGIPYTIYGGRGESLPQAVEGYINRNNPNLLFKNGGKL